jgi:hypothetical protein
MAATEAQFEVAAAEERARSAEELERGRCADGKRAMALVVPGSKFEFRGAEARRSR